MNLKLTLTLPFFMLLSYVGWSQVPENIIARNVGQPNTGMRAGCADQFAGTITFDVANQFHGMSNDVAGTQKFFCFNDFFDIIHNGDANLTGDPDTDTPGGIGYAWYTAKPTISGPDLATILTDPSLLLNPAPAGDMWIYADKINGDARFANKKNIRNTAGTANITIPEWLNGGEPVEVWFAPITYDQLADGLALYEGSPSGPCVNVNISEAFSIVFLTKINTSNATNDATSGSFTVEGGLPQWDSGENYNISIEYVGDSSIKGTVTSGAAKHGDVVTYTLPQVGSYNIIISDGKSCTKILEIRASDGNPLFVFGAGNETGDEGDQICIPITTQMGFSDVVGFQFGIQFDPTVLQYASYNTVSLPATATFLINPEASDPSLLSVIFLKELGGDTSGTTLADNEVLAEICFNLIGNPGDCSDINFVPLPSGSPNEVTRSFSVGNFQAYNGDFIDYVAGTGCINFKGLHGIISDAHGDCGSASKAEFTVDIKEGTPPYYFSWQDCTSTVINGPSIGESHTVKAPPGTYCFTITDSANPSASFIDTVTLKNGPAVGASLLFDPPSCKGATDGQVCVNVSENGTVVSNPEQTYLFEWSNNGDQRCINNVPAGPYAVKVIHSDSGCFDIASGSLTEPPGMTVDNRTVEDPTCNGESDGSISVSLSGGKMPYNFSWSNDNTGLIGAVNGSLPSGTYYLSITDADNCQEIVDTFNLSDPSRITGNFSDLSPVTCFNGIPCDGGATVTVTGGNVGTYDITWGSGEVFSGVTTSTATQLCQGMQFVTITDGECAVQDTILIDAPNQLQVDMALTSSTQTSCKDATDGSAMVSAMGGQSPYNYQWNIPGSPTGNTLPNVAAGTYQVVISDAVGCSTVANIAVAEPDSLIAFVDTAHSSDVSCGGDADGIISVAWTGGNPGLTTYDISGGTSSNISVFTGLSPGDYTITVTDVKGCSNTTSYTINEPAPVVGNIMPPEEPQCAGYRTVIEVAGVIGGQGPGYTYSIDNGPELDITTPTPVFAGEHSIIIYDENGCTFDTTLTILEPAPVVATLPAELNLELGETGIITGDFSSEYALDTVTWTPTDYLSCGGNDSIAVNCLNPTINPLESTLYTLTTTDLNGCTATAEIYVRVDKDRNVFIPNVFTPNGDGINDIFTPVVTNGVTNINFMKIYDRWGELVYELDDYLPKNSFSQGWDGTFNGKALDPQLFVYLIEVKFLDGITLLYRGDITLLSKER